MKLVHRIEVPEDKKACKTLEKSKIMLKNVLVLLDEEKKDLQDFAKIRINKVKAEAKTKVDSIFTTLKKLICPKKVKKEPTKQE